eukprot:2275834-Pleurochrysis_carterae.AAC.1
MSRVAYAVKLLSVGGSLWRKLSLRVEEAWTGLRALLFAWLRKRARCICMIANACIDQGSDANVIFSVGYKRSLLVSAIVGIAYRRVRAANKLGPGDGIVLANALKVNQSLATLEIFGARGRTLFM